MAFIASKKAALSERISFFWVHSIIEIRANFAFTIRLLQPSEVKTNTWQIVDLFYKQLHVKRIFIFSFYFMIICRQSKCYRLTDRIWYWWQEVGE